MDPKSPPTLDPKLKEAYDRVMGATLPKSPPAEQPTMSAATPPLPAHPAEPEKQAMPTSPPMPAHAAPVEQHATTATPTHLPTPTPATTLPHASSGFVASHDEKKPAVSGTLLIIAGVVFFIVYTLFCLKLFGVEIPFLG